MAMPTNLKLDEGLIEATVRLGNFKSKQEAVNTALGETVRLANTAGETTGHRGSFT